jgi:galactokinase
MFLVANGLTEGITKGDVVKMAIASEHRMGLRTGGMDVSNQPSSMKSVSCACVFG